MEPEGINFLAATVNSTLNKFRRSGSAGSRVECEASYSVRAKNQRSVSGCGKQKL